MNPLRLVRETRGITQLELAKMTGIHNTKLCMFEKGWRTPSPDEVKRLRKVLGPKLKLI